MSQHPLSPVITIDGPSWVGKGTLSVKIARALNWHFLDSGVLYRAFAWLANKEDSSLQFASEAHRIAKILSVEFMWDARTESYWVKRDSQNITLDLRKENVSQSASRIASYPWVRQALVSAQREFRKFPGLVADGRDMGTVIFPDASLKFYLTATPVVRAMRRYKQLKEMGENVNLTELEKSIEERDLRDMHREVAPLKKAIDALLIDTTHKTVEEVYSLMIQAIHARPATGKHL